MLFQLTRRKKDGKPICCCGEKKEKYKTKRRAKVSRYGRDSRPIDHTGDGYYGDGPQMAPMNVEEMPINAPYNDVEYNQDWNFGEGNQIYPPNDGYDPAPEMLDNDQTDIVNEPVEMENDPVVAVQPIYDTVNENAVAYDTVTYDMKEPYIVPQYEQQ